MGLFRLISSLFGRADHKMSVRTWDDPLDIAVTTVAEVASGKNPVLVVIRDEGVGGGLGGWQMYDGLNLSGRSPVCVAKPDLIALDPTLSEITDLPVGWEAHRTAPGQPWQRLQSNA